MDDIFSINIKADSTFSLLLEAQNHGHQIYYYLPQDISIKDDEVFAYSHEIKLRNSVGDHCEIIKSQLVNLADADIILFRQDPPFNMEYITSSYALDKLKDRVLIVNDPSEVRNCPEKIFVTEFGKFSPPTLITSSLEQLKQFRKEHGEIIIKPLYGNGGEGIIHLKNDDNIAALFGMMIDLYKTPFVAQKFIKEVKAGDKRILLLDGEPIGAVNRVAKEGEIRSNLHVGGTAHKAQITAKERAICEEIGKELKKRGLIFVGIDVIGDYVTEINVTSPTCIQEISQLDGVNLAKKIWQYLEEKRSLMRCNKF